MFKENMPAAITKLSIVGLICVYCLSAVLNVYKGAVPSPQNFSVVLIGFSLFILAKLSLMRIGKLVSFGTKNMSNGAANAYRFGYWLLAIGYWLLAIGYWLLAYGCRCVVHILWFRHLTSHSSGPADAGRLTPALGVQKHET